MDNQKQKLLIELLVSSPDTYTICESIIEPSYFDPEFRNAVAFIKRYSAKHKGIPTVDMIMAESGVVFEERDVTLDMIDYTTHEIERFCRSKAIEAAIMKAVPLIGDEDEEGDIEKLIKDAVSISLNKNLGVEYYSGVEDRLQRMLNEQPVHSTSWTGVDEALFGGISRKEMLLVAANSGGGKSICLSNLAYNFSADGLNVLYISLELSEDVVAQRFDAMLTGIGRKVWKSHVNEIVTKVSAEQDKRGRIDIIQMKSGTTANQIRAYLKEYQLKFGIIPDLLCLDYLDKMAPNEKIDMSNVSVKDKLCAEQLRDIFVDYNMYGATASQLNRSAVKATEHDHSQIAGGMTKINETDVYWSIVMNESMRAAGEITFIFQKTRNSDGLGTIVQLKWDPKTLLITDGGSPSIKFNPKTDKNSTIEELMGEAPTSGEGSSLLDLMG
jgi:replicative DNA helicase